MFVMNSTDGRVGLSTLSTLLQLVINDHDDITTVVKSRSDG